MTTASVVVTLRLQPAAQARGHSKHRAKPIKAQRVLGCYLARHLLATMCVTPAEALARGVWVTITRVSPGTLDDDNLPSAGKHLRDGVADALGVNDRDARIRWRVLQRRGRTYEAELSITIGDDPALLAEWARVLP